MAGERAWPSPQNNLASGFRDVSPSQRPGPLLAPSDQRSRTGTREWSDSPSQTSPPRHKTGSPSAIDSYGVLRDPRRISPRKVTTPSKHQIRLGAYGTEVNYRRTQSAQDPRRSWSGNARQSFPENRFSTPQYVRPSRMRGTVFKLALGGKLASSNFSAVHSNCLSIQMHHQWFKVPFSMELE
jgi:hypothetical protein